MTKEKFMEMANAVVGSGKYEDGELYCYGEWLEE